MEYGRWFALLQGMRRAPSGRRHPHCGAPCAASLDVKWKKKTRLDFIPFHQGAPHSAAQLVLYCYFLSSFLSASPPTALPFPRSWLLPHPIEVYGLCDTQLWHAYLLVVTYSWKPARKVIIILFKILVTTSFHVGGWNDKGIHKSCNRRKTGSGRSYKVP
jgi:hypothetical protein